MTDRRALEDALLAFADSVTKKFSGPIRGEPEDQLRGPFENLVAAFGAAIGWSVDCIGETNLPDRLGRPDFALAMKGIVVGHTELKAPGYGADPTRFTGRNREQWTRFSSLPNIVYGDGNEWGLYRNGERVGKMVRLQGDVTVDGVRAVGDGDAAQLERLFRDFLTWQPFIPMDRRGRVDFKRLAEMLAPLCRLLRDDVVEALKDPSSSLVGQADGWRQLLFPEASDEQFADSYAQTVTFALLLGRSEGAEPFTLESAESALVVHHGLLSRALQLLTVPESKAEIAAPLDQLVRTVGAVPAEALSGGGEPWLHFYEEFLYVYDPKLRKNIGAYYTPVEVVRAQVRFIDDLIVNRLGRTGFADPAVKTLDPAIGTGTYLLGVIDHALGRTAEKQGEGAVPGAAGELARNLYGFELLVGPYAVSELRVSRALVDSGGELPPDGTQVFLTDTLENPHAEVPRLMPFLQPISEQHSRALKVKNEIPVLVCLGNPPYDRHAAATAENRAATGGWVRWGSDGKGDDSIFHDFIDPAVAAGNGVHIKNLYNLYVYFWRWALWKVFERDGDEGPGIVSFITASSYLDGAAFSGMREHMRRLCDEIWILDLGGEGRGTRQDENVFNIQTPVSIAVMVRTDAPCLDVPATVRFCRVEGTRAEKFAFLDGLNSLSDVQWSDCDPEWQGEFRPPGLGRFFDWPLLTDLMPWQVNGVKAGRTWVIAPHKRVLETRWQALIFARGDERRHMFKDSPTGRKIVQGGRQLPPGAKNLQPLAENEEELEPDTIRKYSYRSFDRQVLLADARVLDRPGPDLWRAHGDKQVYVSTILNHPLGSGPAASACSHIPDLHHFRGSYGAKEVLPLYRDAGGVSANLLPGLQSLLEVAYGFPVTPEDFLAYVYGILAQPAFTERFAEELGTKELRVPLTRDSGLFASVRDAGARLIWLHTYGERFIPEGTRAGEVPRGAARCTVAVPGNEAGYPEHFSYDESRATLIVGTGEFSPVSKEVFDFEVSGLKVVQSWLKYRMKQGAGRKSSPLDDIRPERWSSSFTNELLELLWVLQATLDGYPEQAALLEKVLSGPLFTAADLPDVPAEMRKAPSAGADDEARLF